MFFIFARFARELDFANDEICDDAGESGGGTEDEVGDIRQAPAIDSESDGEARSEDDKRDDNGDNTVVELDGFCFAPALFFSLVFFRTFDVHGNKMNFIIRLVRIGRVLEPPFGGFMINLVRIGDARHKPIIALFFVFDDGEVGFGELNLVDGRRRVHHQVDARAVLREGDDVADVFGVF